MQLAETTDRKTNQRNSCSRSLWTMQRTIPGRPLRTRWSRESPNQHPRTIRYPQVQAHWFKSECAASRERSRRKQM